MAIDGPSILVCFFSAYRCPAEPLLRLGLLQWLRDTHCTSAFLWHAQIERGASYCGGTSRAAANAWRPFCTVRVPRAHGSSSGRPVLLSSQCRGLCVVCGSSEFRTASKCRQLNQQFGQQLGRSHQGDRRFRGGIVLSGEG